MLHIRPTGGDSQAENRPKQPDQCPKAAKVADTHQKELAVDSRLKTLRESCQKWPEDKSPRTLERLHSAIYNW